MECYWIIKIIQIYVEMDYLYDLFCDNNTYIQIYILKKLIQALHHYTAPNIENQTHTIQLWNLHEHLQQHKIRDKGFFPIVIYYLVLELGLWLQQNCFSLQG